MPVVMTLNWSKFNKETKEKYPVLHKELMELIDDCESHCDEDGFEIKEENNDE